MNLVAAKADFVAVMDMYVADRDAAFIAKFNVFVQFDRQLGIFTVRFSYHSNIAVNQVFFAGCVAFHINDLIQFYRNRTFIRRLVEVAAVLHAVVQSSYLINDGIPSLVLCRIVNTVIFIRDAGAIVRRAQVNRLRVQCVRRHVIIHRDVVHTLDVLRKLDLQRIL